ncbi:MAG: hypothetical protein AB7W47_16765 [Calditrichaceae bacterium]
MHKITGGIVLIFLIFSLFSCAGEKDLIPAEISGLKLEKKLTGDEARAFVDNLHFQAVAPSENEIGFYEGGETPGMLYITHYSTNDTADYYFLKMTEKISPENSVFIRGEFMDVDGHNIYRCFGMGQTHFVFAKDRHLIWLSVDTIRGKDILSEYLSYLN